MTERAKRTSTIKVRASAAELAALRERCPVRSLAPWLRELGLGERVVRRPPPADPALLRQLAGAGNLLNQIARRLNAGEWGAADRLEVLAALRDVEAALHEAAL